jgi:hypothetical protein
VWSVRADADDIADPTDDQRLLARRADVELMHLGGGYLMFADAASCCRVSLAPLPWRRVSVARVEALLRRRAGGDAVITIRSSSQARVWRCDVAPAGVSY